MLDDPDGALAEFRAAGTERLGQEGVASSLAWYDIYCTLAICHTSKERYQTVGAGPGIAIARSLSFARGGLPRWIISHISGAPSRHSRPSGAIECSPISSALQDDFPTPA